MDAKNELLERILSAVGSSDMGKTRQEIEAILRPYYVTRARKKRTPTEQIKRFLAAKEVEGLSLKTLDNYRRYLARFAGGVKKDIGRVNADDVRLFITEQNVKETSRQTILNILRSFFSWLVVEEVIKKNPMHKVPSTKIDKKKLRKSLSAEAMEQLRMGCDTLREKALVEFMFSSGCRVSEVAGIRADAVDFTKRRVSVLGKGNKERIVKFSVKASIYMQKYLNTRKGNGPALFANTRAPYGPMSVRSIEKVVSDIGRRAHLPEPVFPHLLRHTLAVTSYNGGMDIMVLQRILGHSNLSTTQIYAEVSTRKLEYDYDLYVA